MTLAAFGAIHLDTLAHAERAILRDISMVYTPLVNSFTKGMITVSGSRVPPEASTGTVVSAPS